MLNKLRKCSFTFHHWIYLQALPPPPVWRPWPFIIGHSPFPQYLILKYAMSQSQSWMSNLVALICAQGFTEWNHPMFVLLNFYVNCLFHRPDDFCRCDWWIRVDESTGTPCRMSNRCSYQTFLSVSPFCNELWYVFLLIVHSPLLRLLIAQRRPL